MISQSEYAREMRQIEERRNAAARQGDRMAIESLRARGIALSQRFFGRRD